MQSGGIDGILTVAYELKAPLMALRQMALALGDLTPADRDLRDEIVAVSERAMRQVNDLAKIRRLEDGLFSLEPVAVRAVCDEVAAELQYLFREEQRGLKVHYANKLRLVSANRELLKSVIYNFAANALHYTDTEAVAQLMVQDRRGAVRVEVRDFGPALPQNVWRELHEGRVEQPRAIAMRPGSSGLGLYIASKFSRYMHAQVGAVRHRDGTSFYVELPVSRQLSLLGV